MPSKLKVGGSALKAGALLSDVDRKAAERSA